MTEGYCYRCGIKTVGNTLITTEPGFLLDCPVCQFQMDFTIDRERTKTDQEVEAIFQQTELTDYQRTGRANKGKWARKKPVSSQVGKI